MKSRAKFFLIPLLVTACSVEAPEVPDVDTDDFYEVKSSYSGYAPVSGSPLNAYLNEGIAPIWLYKAIASKFNGFSYASGKDYPDIFLNKGTGTFNDVDDKFKGGYMFISSYQGKTSDGRLIYSEPELISAAPWDKGYTHASIVDIKGEAYAVDATQKTLSAVKYDTSKKTFGSAYTYVCNIAGVKHSPTASNVVSNDDGTLDVYLLCADGTNKGETMEDVNQGYYDAYGSWRGTIGNSYLYHYRVNTADWTQVGTAEQLTNDDNLIYMPQGVTYFEDSKNGKKGVIVGNKFGVMKYLSLDNPGEPEFLTDGKGNEIINPCLINRMMTIKDKKSTSYTDLITSGEGAFYRYVFTGAYDAKGTPLFSPAEDILCKNHPLYAGSLCVPSVVDWDKDGVLDIVAGNSEGRIMLFKNYATNATPAFGEAVYLKSCGEEVHFRAGYFEVQGPDDGGAWGYICPNVIDWDGDGILDIVTSSNSSRIEIMLGNGSNTADCLGPRMTLTMGGAELWGMWRVRPAVTKIGNDIYLAFMDTENAVHLYKKTSLTSVTDCGQIRMKDGRIITGHRAQAGTTLGERGRSKLEFADWDGDGVIDLLIGTPTHSSFPEPVAGMPENSATSLHLLYFRNAGSNTEIILEQPKQFKFLNKNINLGGHAQSPSVCNLGDTSQGPNLLVGCESGRFYFYKHSDLNFL